MIASKQRAYAKPAFLSEVPATQEPPLIGGFFRFGRQTYTLNNCELPRGLSAHPNPL